MRVRPVVSVDFPRDEVIEAEGGTTGDLVDGIGDAVFDPAADRDIHCGERLCEFGGYAVGGDGRPSKGWPRRSSPNSAWDRHRCRTPAR